MGLEQEFKDLAVELTQEFAGDEIGDSTLYHLATEPYNTETGVVAKTWTEHVAPMTFEKIADGSAVSKIGTYVGTPFEYASSHRTVTVAGDNLSIVPAMGDIIQPPGSLVGHEVVFVDGDMYQAAYVLHVMRTPKDLPVVV